MKKLNKYKIYYRYWHNQEIVDGEALLKFDKDPTKEQVFDKLVIKHNYPKKSRASKYSIIIIKIHKLV